MKVEDLTGPLTEKEAQYLRQAQRAMKDENKSESSEERGSSGIGSKISDALEVEPNFNALLARYKIVVRRNVALALDHSLTAKSEDGKSSQVSTPTGCLPSDTVTAPKPSLSTAATVSNNIKNPNSTSSSTVADTKMTANEIDKQSDTNDNNHNSQSRKVEFASCTAMACDKTDRVSSISHASSDENTYISCVTARPFTYNSQQQEFESTSVTAPRPVPLAPTNSSNSSHSSWSLSSLSPLSYMPNIPSGMFSNSSSDTQPAVREKELAERKKETDDAAEKKRENCISLLELYW